MPLFRCSVYASYLVALGRKGPSRSVGSSKQGTVHRERVECGVNNEKSVTAPAALQIATMDMVEGGRGGVDHRMQMV